jgi:transcriptional regulator with XRE-family HTH domain
VEIKVTKGKPSTICTPNKKWESYDSHSRKTRNKHQNPKVDIQTGRNKFKINMKKKIPIIIESVDEKGYWGRVYIEDNLIVDYSKTLEGLKKKMTKLVFDFHGLAGAKYAFEIQYDISGLFDDKKYLNASAVADRAGISRLMLRQYRSGHKFPTKEKLEKLEFAIHEIGEELKTLKIATMD